MSTDDFKKHLRDMEAEVDEELNRLQTKSKRIKSEAFWMIVGGVTGVIGILVDSVSVLLIGLYLMASARLDSVERKLDELKGDA